MSLPETVADSSGRPADGPRTPRVVVLTPSAVTEVRRLIAEDGRPGIGLRLGIKGGGCSGLSYVLDFTEFREGDTVVHVEDVMVYLDRKSTIYLAGTTLDHQGGLKGKGFVFQNPMATNTCGCGESFSL
jgi:iron-sulfur cluster assembly protein